jgi:hypothetical protein
VVSQVCGSNDVPKICLEIHAPTSSPWHLDPRLLRCSWSIYAYFSKLLRPFEQPSFPARLFCSRCRLVRKLIQLLARHFLRLSCSYFGSLFWTFDGEPDVNQPADGFRPAGLIFLLS